ncbi:MAG: hypothetical protein PVG79_13955 [Gemmatimonadales bacterium]|jgi:hypothetical protein
MKRLWSIALSGVIAALLLFLADSVLQPVPVPAGVAVLGGLAAMWSRAEAGAGWVAVGAAIGALLGTGIHLYVHVTGGSTRPEEGVAAHVAVDGLRGLGVGAVVLVLVGLVARALRSSGGDS